MAKSATRKQTRACRKLRHKRDSAAPRLSLAQRVDALAQEVAALKPDAELYRHLRDHFAKDSPDAAREFMRLEPLTGAAFDAAVRADMETVGVAA